MDDDGAMGDIVKCGVSLTGHTSNKSWVEPPPRLGGLSECPESIRPRGSAEFITREKACFCIIIIIRTITH